MRNQTQKNKNDLKLKSYYFSVAIVKFIASLPNQKVFWVIGDQLLRSATSIGANIVEAKAASSKKDFINFFHISLKSANETLYWLCLLRDATESDKNKISEFLVETNEICKMLGASILTMKQNI
jgi:four helix bundle protein